MTNDKAGRIAVLGLGRMGSAIARCLSTQGYGPIVWNRSAEKAASFDRCADSAVTAIEQASLVFISVTDYASTFAVLEPCATLNLEGRTIMQMSSGTPNEARALDAWVRERGGTYLDAAIVSYPHAIGGPQTLIFIAGPQATYDESSDIFRTLGGNSQYVGIAIGAAATLDCAILQYMYGANLAALQGAAICASEDFPLDQYVAAATRLSPVLETTLNDIGTRVPRGEYGDQTGQGATVAVHLGAIEHIQRLSQDNELSTALSDLLVEVFSTASNAGHAADEMPVLFELLKRGRP